jgi:hypothetical protein
VQNQDARCTHIDCAIRVFNLERRIERRIEHTCTAAKLGAQVFDVLGVRPDEVTLRTSSSFGSTVSPVHRVYARSDRDRWCIDVLSQVKSAQIPFRAPLVPLFKKKTKTPMGVIWGPDLKEPNAAQHALQVSNQAGARRARAPARHRILTVGHAAGGVAAANIK